MASTGPLLSRWSKHMSSATPRCLRTSLVMDTIECGRDHPRSRLRDGRRASAVDVCDAVCRDSPTPRPVRSRPGTLEDVVGGALAVAASTRLARAAAGWRGLSIIGMILLLAIPYFGPPTDARSTPHGRLGPRSPGRVRARRVEDGVGQRTFLLLGEAITRLLGFAGVGRRSYSGRSATAVVAADHDNGARRGRRKVRDDLRVPGAADDHLHRRAVRHPLLLRCDAARRAPVRRRHGRVMARAAPSRSTSPRASSWARPRRR